MGKLLCWNADNTDFSDFHCSILSRYFAFNKNEKEYNFYISRKLVDCRVVIIKILESIFYHQ